MPVTRILRPGTAFPDLETRARHAVSPVSGRAAASSSETCGGAGMTSCAPIARNSCSVPSGVVDVPPRTVNEDSGVVLSVSHPVPGLMSTR